MNAATPPRGTSAEGLLVVTGRRRAGTRLGPPAPPLAEDPSPEQILAAMSDHGRAAAWTLAGGEPTLRPDLPALLEALAGNGASRLGLRTDGLVLAQAPVVQRLISCGLERVRIAFHCGRTDAHDWLVGLKGAVRRSFRAIRTCMAAGLETGVEITVTRPTAAHLRETVELVVRAGVSDVLLRRPRASELPAGDFIGLSPRLGLVEPLLEEAVEGARRQRARVRLEGIPLCCAGSARSCCLGADAPSWVLPGNQPQPDASSSTEAFIPCRARFACAHSGSCPGAPADYVTAFGWDELLSQGRMTVGAAPVQESRDRSAPPPRAGRAPATRLWFAARQAGRDDLGGDPLLGLAPQPLEGPITMVIRAPSRVSCPSCGAPDADRPGTSRLLRQELMRAAQEGVPVLRLVSAGVLAHPQAFGILVDALRLPFARVEVATEASPLDEASDGELERLEGLARLDAALYGPDAGVHDAHIGRPGAFDASLRGLARLGNLTGVATGTFAVLHDAQALAGFASAWESGSLPGNPALRLSPAGGSLDALAAAAEALAEGGFRDAVAALLPPCLLPRPAELEPAEAATPAWSLAPEPRPETAGSDRLGRFRPCPHAAACGSAVQCPGLAEGWTAEGIAAHGTARRSAS